MTDINYLAAFVASFTGLFLGYLWYSVLFVKPWMKLGQLGSNKKGGMSMGMRVGISYLLTLVMSLTLAAFIGGEASPTFGLFAGFAAGFGWVAMAFGSNYLFEQKPFGLFLINAGYNIVLLSIMGLIIGFF